MGGDNTITRIMYAADVRGRCTKQEATLGWRHEIVDSRGARDRRWMRAL